eukprot:scaffold977_cov128-Cylindrotheca_fusiformis.AAC.5
MTAAPFHRLMLLLCRFSPHHVRVLCSQVQHGRFPAVPSALLNLATSALGRIRRWWVFLADSDPAVVSA